MRAVLVPVLVLVLGLVPCMADAGGNADTSFDSGFLSSLSSSLSSFSSSIPDVFALIKKQGNATADLADGAESVQGNQGPEPLDLGQDRHPGTQGSDSQDRTFIEDSEHESSSSRQVGAILEPNETYKSQDEIVAEPRFQNLNSTSFGAPGADPTLGQGSTVDYYDLFDDRNDTIDYDPVTPQGSDYDYYDELFYEKVKNETSGSAPDLIRQNSTRPDSAEGEDSDDSLFGPDPEDRVESRTNGSVSVTNTTIDSHTKPNKTNADIAEESANLDAPPEGQETNPDTLPNGDKIRIDNVNDDKDTDDTTDPVIYASSESSTFSTQVYTSTVASIQDGSTGLQFKLTSILLSIFGVISIIVLVVLVYFWKTLRRSCQKPNTSYDEPAAKIVNIA